MKRLFVLIVLIVLIAGCLVNMYAQNKETLVMNVSYARINGVSNNMSTARLILTRTTDGILLVLQNGNYWSAGRVYNIVYKYKDNTSRTSGLKGLWKYETNSGTNGEGNIDLITTNNQSFTMMIFGKSGMDTFMGTWDVCDIDDVKPYEMVEKSKQGSSIPKKPISKSTPKRKMLIKDNNFKIE